MRPALISRPARHRLPPVPASTPERLAVRRPARANVVCFKTKTTHVLGTEPSRICIGTLKELNEKSSPIGFSADVPPRRCVVIRELCQGGGGGGRL